MKQHLCVLMLGVLSLGIASCGGSGSSSNSSQPVVSNAPAPVISSAATLSAAEGQPYSYNLTATDPAGTPLTYALATKPTGAAITGNVISWTPARTQSRVSNAFTVTVTSAAGGSATQSWSVIPTGIIRGSMIMRYTTDNGVVTGKPSDLTSVPIAATYPPAPRTWRLCRASDSPMDPSPSPMFPQVGFT